MAERKIYIGNQCRQKDQHDVTGKYVDLHGETFYQIGNYDQMSDFFISVVSDSNHWMFISSLGGLSAGRINSESALFPYYSDDKITDWINRNDYWLYCIINTFIWTTCF